MQTCTNVACLLTICTVKSAPLYAGKSERASVLCSCMVSTCICVANIIQPSSKQHLDSNCATHWTHRRPPRNKWKCKSGTNAGIKRVFMRVFCVCMCCIKYGSKTSRRPVESVQYQKMWCPCARLLLCLRWVWVCFVSAQKPQIIVDNKMYIDAYGHDMEENWFSHQRRSHRRYDRRMI